tara:strand:+ start:2151 stop:3788 length:1638 start_codon:yes stop_codon:yes gene_type:complete
MFRILIILVIYIQIGFQSALANSDPELSSLGYANTIDEAKSLALSEIISKLNEKANSYLCQSPETSGLNENCLGSFFYFDIPIEGIKYKSISNLGSKLGQQATLSQSTVKAIYLQKYINALNAITTETKNYKFKDYDQKLSNKQANSLWQNKIFAENFNALLGAMNIEHPQLDKNVITQIDKIQIKNAKVLTSLTEIPSYLYELGDVHKAYLHAPVPKGSVEMTPFSDAVRKIIQRDFNQRFLNKELLSQGYDRGLKKKKAVAEACYEANSQFQISCGSLSSATKADQQSLLVGKYEKINDQFILLYYEFKSATGEYISHTHLKVPLTLLDGIRFEPINKTFDQTLHQAISSDSELHVELVSNRGKRNILVYGGEDISLKFKANIPIYYYLVGHIMREREQFSYLVELGSGQNLFTGQITKEQIGQWMTLGEFTIHPPFGVEHLQLVAANYDLSNRLPKTKLDAVNGYYVIEGSKSDAISGLELTRGMQRTCRNNATRGMQRNCSAIIEVNSIKDIKVPEEKILPINKLEHESILSFTSIAPKDI